MKAIHFILVAMLLVVTLTSCQSGISRTSANQSENTPTIEVTEEILVDSYVAETINLTQVDFSLTANDDEQKIAFSSWSNHGHHLAFTVLLPEVFIDSADTSEDNTHYASELWVGEISQNTSRKIADYASHFSLWSPNDRRILYYKPVGVSKFELCVADLEINMQTLLPPPPSIAINENAFYGSMDWFDDDRVLYVTRLVSGENILWIHNVQSGEIQEVTINHSLDIGGNFWLSPDRTMLASNMDGVLWLGRLVEDTGAIRVDHLNNLLTENSVVPIWSPDSGKLAIQSYGRLATILRIMDAHSRETTEISFSLPIAEVAWSPNNSVLAVSNFSSGTSSSNNIYVVNADGSSLRKLGDFSTTSISWSSDGKYLVMQFARTENTSGKTFRVFSVEAE